MDRDQAITIITAVALTACAQARAQTPTTAASTDLGPHAMTCAEVIVIGAENTTRCENDEVVCYAGFGCIPHR